MRRLKIQWKYQRQLIVESRDVDSGNPKSAYLIRQPYENKLRQQMDRWHGTPFSPEMPQKIQCQLEINQDYLEWNDSNDAVRPLNDDNHASVAHSVCSVRSDRGQEGRLCSLAGSTKSCHPNATSKVRDHQKSYAVAVSETPPKNITRNKPTMRSLRSRTGKKYIVKILK